jgi:hypothetical protein
MKPSSRNPAVLAFATILLPLLLAANAVRAQDVPSAASVGTDNRETPEAKIDDARRALEQAAAQADFASDASEVALLQRAHDDLNAAVDQLQGLQRQRTLDLLSDLDQAMERTAGKLGRLVSPSGEAFGPLVPSRQQLNGLASEAVELQRNAPELQRLPNTIVIQSQPHPEAGAVPGPDQIELVNREPLSWPLGFQGAWPQIRRRF